MKLDDAVLGEVLEIQIGLVQVAVDLHRIAPVEESARRMLLRVEPFLILMNLHRLLSARKVEHRATLLRFDDIRADRVPPLVHDVVLQEAAALPA